MLQTLKITNNSTTRQAVKIKCSDNNTYRIDPVYAFVDPGKDVTLTVREETREHGK